MTGACPHSGASTPADIRWRFTVAITKMQVDPAWSAARHGSAAKRSSQQPLDDACLIAIALGWVDQRHFLSGQVGQH